MLAAVALAGCRTFNTAAKPSDDEYERLSDTSGIRGPLERLLGSRNREKRDYIPGYYEKGRDEFARAEQVFASGDYAAAEKLLKGISRKYEDYAVREDALFLQGEAQFELKKYSKAQDSYDELVHDFPSTKYQDRISERMFTIAGTWLGFPDVVQPKDVKLVSNLEDANQIEVAAEESTSWDPTLAVPILPNFHDGTRPVFDTKGRALQALKSIWMNDPSSPLADDALMMTASHHLREGNHVVADEYFAALRQQYPKSPHFQNAYVLGSHVKLMSYQGSQYDGTRLEEARQLTESSLRLFPDNEMSPRLKEGLTQIEEARARREWENVRFYDKKGRPKAAEVYCREIIRMYPESEYAQMSRNYLAERNAAPAPAASSGWNWNVFPRLEKVPESPAAEKPAVVPLDEEEPGRVSL